MTAHQFLRYVGSPDARPRVTAEPRMAHSTHIRQTRPAIDWLFSGVLVSPAGNSLSNCGV
jgi:hypothetical protein